MLRKTWLLCALSLALLWQAVYVRAEDDDDDDDLDSEDGPGGEAMVLTDSNFK